MMSARMSGAVGLVLLAAACSVTGGCDSSTPQAPAQYPPGYGPYPQGYAPPPGYYPAQNGARPPQPGYVARPGGPQPGYAPGAAPSFVAPGASAFAGAINVAAIQSLVSRNPKGCGFLQVAPNAWSKVDCQAYAPSTRAVAHLSPRKALAITNHTTQWQPLRVFGLNFQQALTQGFSKGIFQRPFAGTQQGVTGGAPSAPVIVADALPVGIDHRQSNLEGPIKDQGPVGACTAFSLSTVIDNAAIRAGKMQGGSGTQATSANHVWAGYGNPQMGAAADATLNRNLSTMASWGASFSDECKISNPAFDDCGTAVSPPVVPGTFRSDPVLMAKFAKADATPAYKVVGFDKIDTQPTQIDQLIQTLATGADIWVAFRIDGFAWSKIQNGVIPDWTEPNGGHAVTMAGYRQTPQGRQFLVHNNWGVSWGEGGYGWMSEAMVQKWMNYAYKIRLDGGVKPADLTDDDCGADEMVDVARGVCAPICPDNSRPNNGCAGGGGAPAAPAIPGMPPGLQIPNIPGLPQGLPSIPGFQLPNFGH